MAKLKEINKNNIYSNLCVKCLCGIAALLFTLKNVYCTHCNCGCAGNDVTETDRVWDHWKSQRKLRCERTVTLESTVKDVPNDIISQITLSFWCRDDFTVHVESLSISHSIAFALLMMSQITLPSVGIRYLYNYSFFTTLYRQR